MTGEVLAARDVKEQSLPLGPPGFKMILKNCKRGQWQFWTPFTEHVGVGSVPDRYSISSLMLAPPWWTHHPTALSERETSESTHCHDLNEVPPSRQPAP